MQLPPEGKTVLLAWEPGGAVLAVVQKLGGAFLWFPSRPESVQQWEGMQFSSSIMRSAVRQHALQPPMQPGCNLAYGFPGASMNPYVSRCCSATSTSTPTSLAGARWASSCWG